MREEPSDPRIHLRQVWRYRWVLVAVAIGIPILVFVISSLLPKTYEATAVLQAPNQEEADRAMQLLQTSAAARQAARKLDGGVIDSIVAAPADQEQQTTLELEGPELFTLTAEADTARAAADLANAYANVRQLEGVKRGEIDAEVLERAQPPTSPIAPEPLRNTAVALVFSLLLAGGLAVLLTAFDRRLRDPEQVDSIIGSPLLASIPERAFSDTSGAGAVAEPFRMLRANLTYMNPDRSLSTVVVTGPGQDEGSTTVAINLATAYAEADLDVLLVDADLRKSSIAKRLGIVARRGVEDVLTGRSLWDSTFDVNVDTERGRLRVLPAGAPPANPAALLSSEMMSSFIESASRQVDMVILDTPPLLAVSDAIPLLPQVSGVLLVARIDRTEREALARTRELAAGTGATILGGVLAGVREGRFERYAYGYGYGADGASDQGGSRSAQRGGWVRRAFDRIRHRPRTEDGQ